MINWLQNWYLNQCDSDWEHDYGIRIETLDNPGWNIKIDLEETNVLLNKKEWQLFELANDNWVGYKIENNIYNASGDPEKLELLILIFKQIVENGEVKNSYIFQNMNT